MGIDLLVGLLVLSDVVLARIAIPSECYTCQSRPDSNICGEGITFPYFTQKFCTINQHYCIKVIEKAGRIPIVYRKCSHYTCEQEVTERVGQILACSVCSTTLCNASTVRSTISLSAYLLTTVIVFYNIIITLLDQS